MAATITVPEHVKTIKGGGTITYKGSVSRCIWWELVGVNGVTEGAAYGTISNAQNVTDKGGYATIIYHAPTVDPGVGKKDRIKVHESVSV